MPHRPPTQALESAQAALTSLGRALAAQLLANPNLSGIHSLSDPREAFAARMLLAKSAERTLDVQYYIWHGDQTGMLLLQALVAAADRGVRVRLLLDDMGTSGLDSVLAALMLHPQIEVRLFNPFAVRKAKFLGYFTDFSRANRRMHNKSFTADNQVSILGGRNVGDEYFGAAQEVLFTDLDVLTVGPVVPEVSQDFDLYWASPSAVPAEEVLPAAAPDALQAFDAEATSIAQSETAKDYCQVVRESSSIQQLLQSQLPMQWARTTLLSDDPKKGQGRAKMKDLLIRQLQDVIGTPERSVVMVSPYFVPTKVGVKAIGKLRDGGIRLRVMTNGYEATDVSMVHAGYAKYRNKLVRQGVELYEMHRKAPKTRRKLMGSSGSRLHAKTFAVDSERAFVGSFNFDPRSAMLNTELGVIIDSPWLARKIERAFDTEIPSLSYCVQLSDKGKMQWASRKGESAQSLIEFFTPEPGTSWMSRASMVLLALLPIEWLL